MKRLAQLSLFISVLCSGALVHAQNENVLDFLNSNVDRYCDENRDEYNYRSDCEYRHSTCEYDSRIGCYIPSRNTSPCDPRYNEYDTQSRCERMHEQGCELEGQCWVPYKVRPLPPAPPPVDPPAGQCIPSGSACGYMNYECGGTDSWDRCFKCCNGQNGHHQSSLACPNTKPGPHIWNYYCD